MTKNHILFSNSHLDPNTQLSSSGIIRKLAAVDSSQISEDRDQLKVSRSFNKNGGVRSISKLNGIVKLEPLPE